MPLAQFRVADPETLVGREAQYADLSLVGVAVYLPGGLAGLLQRVRPGQRRVDPAAGDQPVGLPGLTVVGEVRADDPFQVHPEVPVVVLVQVAAGRGAGDDGTAAFGDEHARAERLPARVLEHDVRVVATGQLADPGAEPAPLGLVLVVLIFPEA